MKRLILAAAVAVMFGAWYRTPLEGGTFGTRSEDDLLNDIRHVRCMEAMAAAAGTLVVKFWLQLDERNLRKNLKHRAERRWGKAALSDEEKRRGAQWSRDA